MTNLLKTNLIIVECLTIMFFCSGSLAVSANFSRGPTCNKGSKLNLQEIPPEWANAVSERLKGGEVDFYVGKTGGVAQNAPTKSSLKGKSMDRLREKFLPIAKEMGCSFNRNDIHSEKMDHFISTFLFATSCFESAWNPGTVFDERKAGGIKGAKSVEDQMSVGLLQLTAGSEQKACGEFVKTNEDLKNPLKNVVCGLNKMDELLKTANGLAGLKKYWSVLGKNIVKIKSAVKTECGSNFASIQTAMAGTAPPRREAPAGTVP